MLNQFSITNFRSIKDKVTFDMQAVPITEHADSQIDGYDGDKYLPISALYGPNGGGKSNVLLGLHMLFQKILRPVYLTLHPDVTSVGDLTIDSFKFDPEYSQRPTEFEIFFSTKMAEYKYEIKVFNDEVLYEKLSYFDYQSDPKLLFKRENGILRLEDKLKNLNVNDGLSATLPLLSLLGITYRNNEVIKDIFHWLIFKIEFLNFGNPMREMRLRFTKSPELQTLLSDMIREMDIDIVDFRIEEQENNKIDIITKHRIDDQEFELNLSYESSGIKKLFKLLPLIALSLVNGEVLVIDELDAKIHPVLLDYIINLYTNKEINKNGAQLIFTSHDLSTMNGNNFRRDEIWFVAKGIEQNSVLYSLVEFKTKDGTSVRKDAKYNKQYLEGKYGADPYLKKIIDWRSYDGTSK